MKKLFFLLSMAFVGMQNVNAQKSEIFGSFSAVTYKTNIGFNSPIKESYNLSGLSLGYNSLRPFIDDRFYLVVGGKLSYIWNKEDRSTENIFRIKVPASIKLKLYNHAKGDANAVEPYAGLNASAFMVHYITANEKYSNSSYTTDMKASNDLNNFTFGCHVGVDFCISNFVIGVCYEQDLTNYSHDFSSKWSSVDFKVGFRFE